MTIDQAQSEHLAKAVSHPKGIRAYCREHGIKLNTFYYWRSKSRALRVGVRPKKSLNSFVPAIRQEVVATKSICAEANDLPSSEWLADFAVRLIRGLK